MPPRPIRTRVVPPIHPVNALANLQISTDGPYATVTATLQLPGNPKLAIFCCTESTVGTSRYQGGIVVPHGTRKWLDCLPTVLDPISQTGLTYTWTWPAACYCGTNDCKFSVVELGTQPGLNWSSLLHWCPLLPMRGGFGIDLPQGTVVTAGHLGGKVPIGSGASLAGPVSITGDVLQLPRGANWIMNASASVQSGGGFPWYMKATIGGIPARTVYSGAQTYDHACAFGPTGFVSAGGLAMPGNDGTIFWQLDTPLASTLTTCIFGASGYFNCLPGPGQALLNLQNSLDQPADDYGGTTPLDLTGIEVLPPITVQFGRLKFPPKYSWRLRIKARFICGVFSDARGQLGLLIENQTNPFALSPSTACNSTAAEFQIDNTQAPPAGTPFGIVAYSTRGADTIVSGLEVTAVATTTTGP